MTKNLPPRPTFPDLSDDAAVAEYKAQLRAWDRDVIAKKLLTVHEINEMNSAFPLRQGAKFKILNFEEALRSQR